MADKNKTGGQTADPKARSVLTQVALALYAMAGLSMALSAFLPYRQLSVGSLHITYTGMQFTENLAWILVVCGAMAAVLGVLGLARRSAPPYAVWLPPGTGLVFAGFFLLLFFQTTPTVMGEKVVLITDLSAWKLVRAAEPRSALGPGLVVTAISVCIAAAFSIPVFRAFRAKATK